MKTLEFFDPFALDNFHEAVIESREGLEKVLTFLSSRDYAAAGKEMQRITERYWERINESKTEDMILTGGCCWGSGCDMCEPKRFF